MLPKRSIEQDQLLRAEKKRTGIEKKRAGDEGVWYFHGRE